MMPVHRRFAAVGTKTFCALLIMAGFALRPYMAQAQQTYTDLHDFNPGAGEPVNLYATGLVPQGWNGNLYGVSLGGGTSGLGTVYNITLSGMPTVLDSFDRTNGADSYYGLTLGSDGNFYGVTVQGGSSNDGTVFKMTPTGTLTVLYSFTGGADGGGPFAPPVQGTDGNFYGVTTGIIGGAQTDASTFYKVTPSGTFKTVDTLTTAQGVQCVHTNLGSDGNFYASCNYGGTNNNGTVFKISAAGHLTVLHNMTAATDGTLPTWAIQATDGNFYGAMGASGPHNAGTIYQLKTNGTFKVLYSPTGGADGGNPLGPTQGSDGNLYGPALAGGNTTACSGGCGVIYKMTTAGAYSVLYTFDSTHGANPESKLTLDTDGVFYGNTQAGGANGDGVFYSFDLGFSPFITLGVTSGKVGTKVGIMGQDFSSSSVVKFGGVKATTVTLTGTTYIVATVPAGAVDGKVTVTTGSTTLTSTKTFIVHNSWSSAAVMPTALQFPGTGVISGKVYVVGGVTNTAIVGNNQVYNPATNTWTSAAAMPTPVFGPASAVVGGILYVIGGYDTTGSTATDIVQAYNPTTKTWSTKTAMPTARGSAAAVVDGTAIYVIGGNGTTLRLDTVEKFVPSTDTWTEEAPLLVGKSEPSAGLLGTKIAAADGFTTSGFTGDNEGYDTSTNIWSSLASDPTARNASCYGSVGSLLYVAGGDSAGPSSVTESYSATANKWTTLIVIPQAVVAPGSAEVGGLLYCFGGSNNGTPLAGTVFNNVQIYQP
jgi:uncharacterized repeat protein (TIGR03803 family)